MGELRSWSAKGLIEHLRELYDLIYVRGKYTLQDVTVYWAIINELDRRGYMTGKVKAEY